MRVALAQIISTPDPAANLHLVDDRVRRAAERGAQLVVFPEATMRCFGHSLSDVAEPTDGPWADHVRRTASRYGVVVVAGMFTPAAQGRVHNTLLVTGPGVEAHYDKIHLFDAFGFTESATVAPGAAPIVVQVDGVGVGFATCYDLRFPGIFTTVAERGAEIVIVCASWAAGPGKVEQWRLLTRARALDATVFVAACGQADPGASSTPAPTGVGYSVVVSPNGEVVSELGEPPGLLVADIDVSQVAAVRRTLPVLANRRL
jgi:predicted amidohydrolase